MSLLGQLAESRQVWVDDAACRDVDPDVFFPVYTAHVWIAKAYCAGCPVRAECLEYALDNNEGHGIWGGLDEAERRRIRRQRRRTATPPRSGSTAPSPALQLIDGAANNPAATVSTPPPCTSTTPGPAVHG